MMGKASEAVAPHHEGGEGGATRGLASGSTGSSSSSGIGTASSGWSSSFVSSTTWSVGDDEDEEDGDGATSSSSRSAADRRRHFSSLSSSSSWSSTSSESEASQMSEAAGGPLYGMSTIRDHLPPPQGLRTGLSMYYQGRSESFTSLADVSCVEDLAKKATTYTRRPMASRGHAAALGVKNRLSKTVAKKAPSGRKPAASDECQGKRGLYRC